jgi:outer membrane usher protein
MVPGQKLDAQQPKTDIDLLLAVVINGRSIDMVGEFKQHDTALFAQRRELEALGFQFKLDGIPAEETTEMPLSKLPGVSYRVDEKTQTIYFTAANTALKPTVVRPDGQVNAKDLPVESGLGAVVNYNTVATMQNGHTLAEGLTGVRVFSPWGVISSSFIATAGAQPGTNPLVRLDTTYSYSDVDELRRYRAGDVINGGLAWTRPVRLGGIQITTDFSIRPDLVTFPVPTISGAVAVPSSIDVLVNGVQLLSRDVPPGPFQLNQLPVVTGAGNVSLVVRNAVGQETTQSLPVYTSNLLLARGLSSFSAEIGALRLNYGTRSDDYHVPAASISGRHGVLDWLTVEGHAEGNGSGSGYAGTVASAGGLAGGGVAVTLGTLGVVSVAAAGSHYQGHLGQLASVSYERITTSVSLSASVQMATRRFNDIAASSGEAVPTMQTRASIGLPLRTLGSFGLTYVGIRRPAQSQQSYAAYRQQTATPYGFNLVSLLPATKVSLISASYSRQIFGQRAYLYASAFHDFASSSSTGLMIGITVPLGRRSSAGVSANRNGRRSSAAFQASQSTTEIGDVGWQLQEDTGKLSRQMAVGEYRSPWGLVDAGFDRISGQTAYRATAQGALAFADGQLFASNTIDDSFAVVDTDKTPGIQVLQENRPVGRTDSSGRLLVPSLRSFDGNRLGINPADVPVDVEMGTATQLVRPQDHSGIVVRFPVRVSRGAIIRLVDAKGVSIPVSSSARLDTGTTDLPVGYDGQVYATGLAPHNSLMVTLFGGKTCKASFDYTQVGGTIPEIGPILCKDMAP